MYHSQFPSSSTEIAEGKMELNLKPNIYTLILSTEIINGLVSINALLGWNSNSNIYGKSLYNETVENQLSCSWNLEGSGCCWNGSL